MSNIRIAVAGAGVIGQQHLRAIAAQPGAELAGIADPAPRAREQAAELRVPWASHTAELLRLTRPDALVIALPNELHAPAAHLALAERIPILVEKPVCVTVEEALDLADRAESAGVPALVGHHRRHSGWLEQARSIVESGPLGRLTAVQGLCWFRKPATYFEGGGLWRRALPSGGVTLINLIHVIDDLRWLAGEIESVQAMTSCAARGFQVEDTASLSLRFRNGALGTVSISDAVAAPWSWEMTAGENPVYPHTSEACYLLGGQAASLSVPRLEIWRHADWHRPLEIERVCPPAQAFADPLLRQMDHFCALVRGEETAPRVTLRDAARTLAATLAVRESAAAGTTVRLA